MSKASYTDIRNTINRMLEIEFNSSIKEIKDVEFYIDDKNDKLIIKNHNSDYDFDYLIGCYFCVLYRETIIHFQIGYTFNEYELIEFNLDLNY